MGSTVIVLFPKNKIAWESGLEKGSSIKFGELLGEVL